MDGWVGEDELSHDIKIKQKSAHAAVCSSQPLSQKAKTRLDFPATSGCPHSLFLNEIMKRTHRSEAAEEAQSYRASPPPVPPPCLRVSLCVWHLRLCHPLDVCTSSERCSHIFWEKSTLVCVCFLLRTSSNTVSFRLNTFQEEEKVRDLQRKSGPQTEELKTSSAWSISHTLLPSFSFSSSSSPSSLSYCSPALWLRRTHVINVLKWERLNLWVRPLRAVKRMINKNMNFFSPNFALHWHWRWCKTTTSSGTKCKLIFQTVTVVSGFISGPDI